MSKHEHTVALREMRKDEFAEFRDEFIEDWAEDLSRVEEISLASARLEATRRSAADLTNEQDTERRRIRVICLGGRAIGTLWYSFANGRAFVDDISVAQEFRGNGFGQRALDLMEAELSVLGVALIQLNVYAHNPRARKLYEKFGFSVTGVTMSKRIPS